MSEYTPARPPAPAIARAWIAGAARRLRGDGPAPSQDRAEALSLRNEGSAFVIVTGAGRSGTSAVARVLHESGVRMGNDLAEPSDTNPDGFYEDWGALWLNERLLRDAGMGDRWRPERWPSRATVLAAARRYRDEMAALVADAADGWKDPRFSITLEAWLPLLPAKPKLIVCVRSPRAYAESILRIFGLVETAVAERQWARHYRRLLDVIRDYQLEVICVEYDALVERPEETVAAFSTFVGRPLRAEFVNPPLRRHVRSVPKRYERLYGRVLALGREEYCFPTRPPRKVMSIGGHPQTPSSGAPPLCTPRSVEDYLTVADEIIARVREAKVVWETETGMPRPVASAGTRTVCEEYRSVLCEAQEEIAQLEPPRELAHYHETAVREINLQRMIVELTLNAVADGAADQRMLKAAVGAWKRFRQLAKRA